jgi:hypothetical protein
MAFGSGNKSYKPGQVVPKAGVYRVIHSAHRAPHEASLKANETFPSCRQCGEAVRFTLVVSSELKKKPSNPEE